jgi:hypothetical protein
MEAVGNCANDVAAPKINVSNIAGLKPANLTTEPD